MPNPSSGLAGLVVALGKAKGGDAPDPPDPMRMARSAAARQLMRELKDDDAEVFEKAMSNFVKASR